MLQLRDRVGKMINEFSFECLFFTWIFASSFLFSWLFAFRTCCFLPHTRTKNGKLNIKSIILGVFVRLNELRILCCFPLFQLFSTFCSFMFSHFYFSCFRTFTGIARSSVKTLFSEDLESRYLLVLALSMDSAVDAFLGLHWFVISVFLTQNASPLSKAWCLWSSWFQRIHMVDEVIIRFFSMWQKEY